MLSGCAGDPNAYTLKGSAEVPDGKLFILTDQGKAIDSAEVKKGEFRFKGVVGEAGFYHLSDSQDPRQMNILANFFLEPGELTLEKGDRSYQVKGTPANEKYNALNDRIRGLFEEYKNPETTEERKEALLQEVDELQEKAIEENFDNILGVTLFFQSSALEAPAEEALAKIKRFTPEMQQTKGMKKFKEFVENKMRSEVGRPYIDFTQPDKDNKPVSLKSVVETEGNKYVLLDFWASWCGPCRGELPYLVEAYKQYHKKGFEIYGVSLDEKAESWQKIITEKKMDWINVSDLAAWKNAAAQQYAVMSIPSNFLIDCATGKIIAKDLRGEQLAEELGKLLK